MEDESNSCDRPQKLQMVIKAEPEEFQIFAESWTGLSASVPEDSIKIKNEPFSDSTTWSSTIVSQDSARNKKGNIRNRCRDPVYDLFTFKDDPNIALCGQENCSARLVRKATTLKRHLQRFHDEAYNNFTKSKTSKTNISVRPSSSLNSTKKKNARETRRDPVYDYFSFNDEPNIATCRQGSCSVKLGKKATTLKRHLRRFHMNVFELMTRSSHRVQAPTESQILPECTDTGIDEEFDEDDEQPLSFFTLKEKKLDRAIESSNRFEISTDNQTVLPDCTDTEIDEEPDEDDVQPFTLFNLAENELNNETNTRCRDPVYDLFTLTETPSIVICNQEYCSAKLAKRASTLKRHLRRFHITAHDILAESTSSIAEIALDFRPLSLPTPKKKNEKKASSSQCRRDPVYNLFTSKEDPSVVICKIDNCSTKLARKSHTLKRHLQRFHNNSYNLLTGSKDRPETPDDNASLDVCVAETNREGSSKVKKKDRTETNAKNRRRDPVYDLFTFYDDPNIAFCKQENCSAKLVTKATSLKRHLQRFHKNIFKMLAESSDRSQK